MGCDIAGEVTHEGPVTGGCIGSCTVPGELLIALTDAGRNSRMVL